MNRTPVVSSNVKSVGYDPETETLEVAFAPSSRAPVIDAPEEKSTIVEVYQYHGVPLDVYEALMAAPSIGNYFHTAIRDSYRWNRATLIEPKTE